MGAALRGLACSRGGLVLAVSAGIGLWALPAAAQLTLSPPRGSIDSLYSHYESEENSVDQFSQRWNVLWEDLLPNGDRFSLDFTGAWDRSSERDYVNVYPSYGAIVQGANYVLRSRYSLYENRGYQNGAGILTQESWETNLVLLDLLVDEIRLSYERDTAEDDLDPQRTDTRNQRTLFGFTHQFEELKFLDSLQISGQHWEEEFENNISSEVRIPFGQPVALAARGGEVYVADFGAGQVVVLSSGLSFLRVIDDGGTGLGPIQQPSGVAVDFNGRLYVSDGGRHRVLRFREDGSFDRSWGDGLGSAEGQFNQPQELAVAEDGTVYVADSGNRRVQRLRPGAGDFEVFVDQGLIQPSGLAVDGQNRLYVCDRILNVVSRYSPNGNLELTWGAPGVGPGEFSAPLSVTIDGSAFVYVADSNNNRIQRFTPEGVYLSEWGSEPGDGPLRFPRGVETDGLFVYVADSGNGLIRKYTLAGSLLESSTSSQSAFSLTRDDSFSTDFSFSPTEWLTLFGAYRTHLLQAERTNGSETETWTHDGSFRAVVRPVDFWTMTGGATARYERIRGKRAQGGLPPSFVRSEDTELNWSWFGSTSLQIRENMRAGLSHTNSWLEEDGSRTTASRTTSGFWSSRPWERLFLDFRGGLTETEALGQKQSRIRSWGYTARGVVSEEVNLIWSHDFTRSTQFSDLGDRDTSAQTAKLDLNAHITRRTTGRLSYVHTESRAERNGEGTDSQFDTLGVDVTQHLTQFAYLSGEARHVLSDPGELEQWLFSGTFGCRWADRYNLSTSYTDFQNGDRTRDWSTRLSVQLRPRSTLELAYQRFQEDDGATTQSANARLTVRF